MFYYPDAVLVAVFCVIAAVSSERLALLPVLLALLFPSSPVPAAFTAMVTVVVLSGVLRITKVWKE